MGLGAYIKARVHVDSYLEKGSDRRERWIPTPFWNGELMHTFQAICSDHCRLLYIFHIGSKPFLLKIDDDPAFIQCEREIDLWKDLEKQDRRFFVPIICSEGSKDTPPWIVCPVVPRLELLKAKEKDYEQVNDLMLKYDIRDLSFNKNWFIYNGRPLIVDYGVRGTWEI